MLSPSRRMDILVRRVLFFVVGKGRISDKNAEGAGEDGLGKNARHERRKMSVNDNGHGCLGTRWNTPKGIAIRGPTQQKEALEIPRPRRLARKSLKPLVARSGKFLRGSRIWPFLICHSCRWGSLHFRITLGHTTTAGKTARHHDRQK